MADVTQDEWKEWRELLATREMIKRSKEFRLSYILGIGGMPREDRNGVVDCWLGMGEIIDMMDNVHKEG